MLGIDNVIFISILAGKLPAHQQDFVRRFGVGVAAISRLLLLFWIAWIMGVTATWFSAFGQDISGRDVILIAGGLLLIYKAVNELHQRLEGATDAKGGAVQATLAGVMMHIFVLDMVFALDSIINAVGMVEDIRIMVVAIVLATIRMVLLASHLHRFVQRHPTVKVLARSFLMMIGMVLIADGFDVKISKGVRPLCDGLRGVRRAAQHVAAQGRPASGGIARALRREAGPAALTPLGATPFRTARPPAPTGCRPSSGSGRPASRAGVPRPARRHTAARSARPS